MYILDVFTLHAASGSFKCFAASVPDLLSFLPANAAIYCLRSLTGFGFPLFAPAMFDALGYGKGCTLLAGVSIVLGCPAYVYLCYYSTCVLLTPLMFVDRGFFGSMGNGFG